MFRNVLGSLLALIGAAVVVWSPFRAWYGGSHGSDIRVDDLFTEVGVTPHRAALLGSLFLPLTFAALLTLLGVLLRSRLLVALAGLLVLGVTTLWMVRQPSSPAPSPPAATASTTASPTPTAAPSSSSSRPPSSPAATPTTLHPTPPPAPPLDKTQPLPYAPPEATEPARPAFGTKPEGASRQKQNPDRPAPEGKGGGRVGEENLRPTRSRARPLRRVQRVHAPILRARVHHPLSRHGRPGDLSARLQPPPQLPPDRVNGVKTVVLRPEVHPPRQPPLA